MVTMSDVARLAGVSKMTVSNVVNNRPGVSEPVRRRVLEAIQQSGYRLNVNARTLKAGRTGVIGLAVPGVDQPYYGMLGRARDRGPRRPRASTWRSSRPGRPTKARPTRSPSPTNCSSTASS